MLKNIQDKKFIIPILGIGIICGSIIVLALSITTLVKVNKKFHETVKNDKRSTINSKALQQSSDSILGASIHIEEVMSHLNELQRIAISSNGTRVINTPGFNGTLDYISNYLTANTNYKVTKAFFFLRDFALANNPILTSSIGGVITNYTYSSNLSSADFYHAVYSTSAKLLDYDITVIPNVGCSDDDWRNATPSPVSRVALVKRGECTFVEKAALAAKYNVAALLIYNDGATPDRIAPIEISLGQDNTVPTLFLSFPVGQALANATQDTSKNTKVQLVIDTKDLPDLPVGNICADTPTGNITQTIVIGSHTDSVSAGPGINDNGKIIA
jgi:hypothetical protein